jgi:hypothetical protein
MPTILINNIMSSSTKVDVNYLSVSNNVWESNAGSSNPTPANNPGDNAVLTPDHPVQYASILKICDFSIVSLSGLVVNQGAECSVDINNHATTMLHGSFGESQNGLGNQIFSVKGASHAILRGVVKGSGNRMGADILVDNWSDQAYGGSIVDVTKLCHETAGHVRVVKRYGASIIVGNHTLLKFQSLKLTAYWWVKWLVRKILKIPVDQKGPSWL